MSKIAYLMSHSTPENVWKIIVLQCKLWQWTGNSFQLDPEQTETFFSARHSLLVMCTTAVSMSLLTKSLQSRWGCSFGGTVPLRNKQTIGHFLFVSVFEDWRVQILSKCIPSLRPAFFYSCCHLRSTAFCFLASIRLQWWMTSNHYLHLAHLGWPNDWEKFQAVSSLAVKLSEIIRSDDHVRDNPGGQVACFCAELKLFSVTRLSRMLLKNWLWTSQRVRTWAPSKTLVTKWRTSSERQSSHEY